MSNPKNYTSSSLPDTLRFSTIIAATILGRNPLAFTSIQRLAALSEIQSRCFSPTLPEASSSSSSSSEKSFTLSIPIALGLDFGTASADHFDSSLTFLNSSAVASQELLNFSRNTIISNLIVCYGIILLFILVAGLYFLFNYKKFSSSTTSGGGRTSCCTCLFGSNKKPKVNRNRRGAMDRADRYQFNAYNFGRDDDDDESEQEEDQAVELETELLDVQDNNNAINHSETLENNRITSFSGLLNSWGLPSRIMIPFLLLISGVSDAVTNIYIQSFASSTSDGFETIDIILVSLAFLLFLLPIIIFLFLIFRGTYCSPAERKFEVVSNKLYEKYTASSASSCLKKYLYKFIEGDKCWKPSSFRTKYSSILKSVQQVRSILLLDISSSLVLGICNGFITSYLVTNSLASEMEDQDRSYCNSSIISLYLFVAPQVFLVCYSLDVFFICGCEKFTPFFGIFDRVFVLLISLCTCGYGAVVLILKVFADKLEELKLNDPLEYIKRKDEYDLLIEESEEQVFKIFDLVHAVLCVIVILVYIFTSFVLRNEKESNDEVSGNPIMNEDFDDCDDFDEEKEGDDDDAAPRAIASTSVYIDENEDQELTERVRSPSRKSRRKNSEDRRQQQQQRKRDHNQNSAIDDLLSKMNPSMSQRSFSLLSREEEDGNNSDQDLEREVFSRREARKQKKMAARESGSTTPSPVRGGRNNKKDEEEEAPTSPRVQKSLSVLRSGYGFI